MARRPSSHGSPLAGEGSQCPPNEDSFTGAGASQVSLRGIEGGYLRIKCLTSSYLRLDETGPAVCLTMENLYGLKTLDSFLDHHDRLTVKSFTMV